MGFSTKELKLGRGFIWRENIGEAGTWGIADLKSHNVLLATVLNVALFSVLAKWLTL